MMSSCSNSVPITPAKFRCICAISVLTIGVLTALTPEHMENFPDGLDQVAVEELTLASASKIFLANLDEIPAKYRRKYIDAHPHHHYYGLDKTAEYWLRDDQHRPSDRN